MIDIFIQTNNIFKHHKSFMKDRILIALGINLEKDTHISWETYIKFKRIISKDVKDKEMIDFVTKVCFDHFIY